MEIQNMLLDQLKIVLQWLHDAAASIKGLVLYFVDELLIGVC
jgi:hypothetical protein